MRARPASKRTPARLPLLLALALASGGAAGACSASPAQAPAEGASEPRPAHRAGLPGGDAGSGAALPVEPAYPPPPAPDPPIRLATGGKRAVSGKAGLVTSVEPNATRIGVEILRRGGNAVDAAVAVAYALAVTHPSAGNIGGGGFMIVRRASGEVTAIDFREISPAAVTTEKLMEMVDMTKDAGLGWRSPAVPGSVAGMNLAREKFGTMPLEELMEPAIELAKKGHRLGARQATVLSWSWDKLRKDPSARAVFSAGGRGKRPLRRGELFVQPDLAKTLERIAKEGDQGFYEGPVAEAIDEAMRKNGGYVTADDMRRYKARIRTPLRFDYRGFTVDTMPPPSMGGIAFAEIMLILERLRAHEAPAGSGDALHFFVEAAKRAYSERRTVGGDPDFASPGFMAARVSRLLHGAHLETRKPAVDPDHATPATALAPTPAMLAAESPQTTHFSVVDASGNAVSCTTTQSAAFGSKIVIPGTGLLLSNAEGAFSETGVNTVAPGKRPSSSMTPAIVTQRGKLVALLGSPGGDTIPNTVAQVFRNLVDYRMTIDEAVLGPRLHHQWLPDEVRVEKLNPPSRAALLALKEKGHALRLKPTPIGDANNIVVDPESGEAFGFADRREGGLALGLDRVDGSDESDGK